MRNEEWCRPGSILNRNRNRTRTSKELLQIRRLPRPPHPGRLLASSPMWAYAHPDFAAVSGGQCGAGRTAVRAALLDTIQLPSRRAQAESVIGPLSHCVLRAGMIYAPFDSAKHAVTSCMQAAAQTHAELRLLEAQLVARGAASLLPRCQAARSARWRQRQQRQQRLM